MLKPALNWLAVARECFADWSVSLAGDWVGCHRLFRE